MVAATGNHLRLPILIASVSTLLGGCFYVDPINQRPSLEILNRSGQTIARGQEGVMLEAVVDDPDGQFVKLHWRLYICDDATEFATCDPEPALESSSPLFTFDAPVLRAVGTPAQSLLVQLEGVDDHGATARPSQQLIIPLGDASPRLEVDHESNYGATVGTPIDVFAVYDDPDDPADTVTLTFELFAPALSSATLADVCTPQPGCLTPADPTKLEQGKRFVPDVPGNWEVHVTATDPVGGDAGTFTLSHTVVVVPDQLPCLGPITPLAPAAGATLPIDVPTVFEVYSVDDALDPYPTDLGDPLLGQAQFHWSIRVNGGARQSLDTETGNLLAFDPDSFVPGDTVELRVEVADRSGTFPAPTCGDGEPTCALDTTRPSCLQRQTWAVEVQ